MSQTLHQTKLRALVRATARRYLRASVRALLSYARARSRRVARATAELRVLEQLLPTENGITVFDAENQATSYGIWFLDDLPFIFDTHRKDGRCVDDRTPDGGRDPRPDPAGPGLSLRCGVPRPRSASAPVFGCYFKDNLHVYSFSGPVRGFDLVAAGRSVASVEQDLRSRTTTIWPRVPHELLRAQRRRFEGKRRVRHAADLEILRRRSKERSANRP